MNHLVAYQLINAELAAYRELSHLELSQMVGDRQSRTVRKDGLDYNVASTIGWCAGPNSDIRVRVFVDQADWGNPHDPMDDTMIVVRSKTP